MKKEAKNLKEKKVGANGRIWREERERKKIKNLNIKHNEFSKNVWNTV